MILNFKVTSGGVPDGSYFARFVGIESVDEASEAFKTYGAGIKWIFEIAQGSHAGTKASRITQPNPTLKNACGRMLAGLLGKGIANGEEANLEGHIGQTYLIVCQSGRVESASLPPKG